MDEDDSKWVASDKKNNVIIKQFHDDFRSKTHLFLEIKLLFEIENDALMHREGSKGEAAI